MMQEVDKNKMSEFLGKTAEEYEGVPVKLFFETEETDKKLIGQYPLIAFEGDCVGDVLNEVKVVIGKMEDDNPENVFHFIKSPQSIQVEKMDDQIKRIVIKDQDSQITELEFEGQQ